jgi:CBS domain-containing protein
MLFRPPILLARCASPRGLVVVDGMSPAGLFTHREALVARRLPPNLRRHPVEEVMSRRVLTVDPSAKIHRAAGRAWSANARRIAVMERTRPVGIVSAMDFVRAFVHASA